MAAPRLYPNNIYPNGDTVRTCLEHDDLELKRCLTLLHNDATTGAPSDPQDGTIWYRQIFSDDTNHVRGVRKCVYSGTYHLYYTWHYETETRMITDWATQRAGITTEINAAKTALQANLDAVDTRLTNALSQATTSLNNAINAAKTSLENKMDTTFPIGTILAFSGNAAIPTGWHLCDGTDGTPDLRDRFLMGASTTHPTGTMVAAGLPNITGDIYMTDGLEFEGVIRENGALYHKMDGGAHEMEGEGGGCATIYFDASRCSSVYKDDCTTVQPPAYTVRYIIRVS